MSDNTMFVVRYDDKVYNLTHMIILRRVYLLQPTLKTLARSLVLNFFMRLLASEFSTKLDLSGFSAEIRRDDGVQPFLFRSIL